MVTEIRRCFAIAVVCVLASATSNAAAESASDRIDPVHQLSLVFQAGPAWWVTDSVCGSFSRCPNTGVALAGTLLVRPIEWFSVGASVVRHLYGTVSPSFPDVAMSTHSVHVDLVGRVHFGPLWRFLPWAQIGMGSATVYTECAEGGRAPCGADPSLPTDDSVSGLSVRPSGGTDFAITDWLFANAALDVLVITNGDGHVCGRGACATSPGTRIAPALLFGVSVGLF